MARSLDPATLRAVTEDDVAAALTDANVTIDAKPADLLEFFNRMLDLLGVPDLDADVAGGAD